MTGHEYAPVFEPMSSGRPLHSRLYVHVPIPDDERNEIWGDPRPAQLDDLIAVIRRLRPEAQAYIATNLGLVPETVGERLEAAEDVLEALADARLAIRRLDAYRERFPEQRSAEEITVP